MSSASSAAIAAHQRALAGVAIAAAAEHARAAGPRQCSRAALQRLGERVGRVRVVDDGERRAAAAAEHLHAPAAPAARAPGPAPPRPAGCPSASSTASTVERIVDVEVADQPQRQLDVAEARRRPSTASPRRLGPHLRRRARTAPREAARCPPRCARSRSAAPRQARAASARAEGIVDVDDARARARVRRTGAPWPRRTPAMVP